MPYLMAKDVRSIEDQFVNLLWDIPGDKETKQRFFERMKVVVPRTNYSTMWQRLVERLDRASAGEAVFDCLLQFAEDRLKSLLEEAMQDNNVSIRDSDHAIVCDLFFNNGNLRRIGELLVEYIEDRGLHSLLDTIGGNRLSQPSDEPELYDVALSYAGEDRGYVDLVATQLRNMGIRLFYAEFERADLWGKDLYVYLDDVYRKLARYCVMFLSENYAGKEWPSHERASAQARAFQEPKEYILPVRLDDTEIPGIRPTTSYLDARILSPEDIAKTILKKCTGS